MDYLIVTVIIMGVYHALAASWISDWPEFSGLSFQGKAGAVCFGPWMLAFFILVVFGIIAVAILAGAFLSEDPIDIHDHIY